MIFPDSNDIRYSSANDEKAITRSKIIFRLTAGAETGSCGRDRIPLVKPQPGLCKRNRASYRDTPVR